MRADRRFPAARPAGHEDTGALEVTLAFQHRVEIGNAAGNTFGQGIVREPARRDRHHRDALLVDDERVLVGSVSRAAILDDAQPTRRKLILDAVVEQDHAVGDVFFQAVARQRAFAALAGDDGGNALFLEPFEQTAQFGAQQQFVFEAAEQGLDGIDNDALGADGVDGIAEADEKALEIVFAGLVDLGALDLDVVDGDLLLGDQLFDVVVERADVLDEVSGPFFESKEDAGLVVFDHTIVKEGHGEQRLAAAGRPAQQSRAPLRKAALSDLVEAENARWRLAYGRQIAKLRAYLVRHSHPFQSG